MIQALTLLLTLAQIPPVDGQPTDFIRMRYIDLKAGDGPAAQPTQKFTVHYTGWLTDGKKFDSSVDRKEPFIFIQGRRQVIAGWDAGFEGMKVGGKRRLFIPYQMAYGEKGRGEIPPKAELIFDVELLGVENVMPQPPAQDFLNSIDDLAARLRSKADPKALDQAARLIALYTWAAKEIPSSDLFARHAADATSVAFDESLAALNAQLTPLRGAALDREIKIAGRSATVRGYYITLVQQLATLAP